MNTKKCLSAGFTFIETLVAISILLFAVVGPLTLVSNGLRTARIARDQINADYLAQEVVEYVRYRRDTNTLNDQGWLSGLDTCIDSSCTVDVFTESITACDEGACVPIQFYETDGVYGYGHGDVAGGFDEGWSDTKFTRTTEITNVNTQEALVVVTVSWKDGLINRTFTVSENIFDWQ